MRQRCERDIDGDACQSDERQRREHTRNVQPVPCLDDTKSEAGLAALCASRQFRGDGADQGEAAADTQAGEKERQRGRDFETP